MDKVHIVITGRRNTGKSSLINCILGQNKAVVSEVAGTTTDPVKKSFELPGIASIVFTDTAGIDDEGDLGLLRINKTYEAIRQADVAILVITDNIFSSYEEELIREFQNLSLPFIILHNQSDRVKLLPSLQQKLKEAYQAEIIPFSTLYTNPEILIDSLRQLIGKRDNLSLLGGLIEPGQVVMLVTPIDSEAPTGRMILPQVQMLRDILDNQCISIVLQPQEIPAFFSRTDLMPDLVVTDSQAFSKVAPLIPSSVALTSFSIVLAHHKGNFQNYLQGTRHIENLHDGNRILMLESCSHHVSCEDIGSLIKKIYRKTTGI